LYHAVYESQRASGDAGDDPEVGEDTCDNKLIESLEIAAMRDWLFMGFDWFEDEYRAE
jgi:hypothetical protein